MLKSARAGRVIEEEMRSKLVFVDCGLVVRSAVSKDPDRSAIGSQLLLVLDKEPPAFRAEMPVDRLAIFGCIRVPQSEL